MQQQIQINFEELDARLDRIQDFVMSVLKEKNPQAYLKFYAEINQEKNMRE